MNDLFDKKYREYDQWYDRHEFAYLSELEAVKKVLPEKGRGLEVGVGTGRFASPLGMDVGIDPSLKMVEFAKGKGVDARPGSGERLQFADGEFDYVALIFTICFVRDPAPVIKESARVLKDGGRIIVGIVDKDSFLGKIYQNDKKSVFYGNARFFSVAEVTKMLEKEGFDGFLYYQTLFDDPDKMKSVESPKEGYGEGGFVVIGAVKCAKHAGG